MTQNAIEETIEMLFTTVGVGVLDDPLRFEAFLRDLHPNQPAEVSVLTESLISGAVDQLMRRVPVQECTATLSAKSGVAPRYADWAMQLWLDVIPTSLIVEQQEKKILSERRWEGTVDEVLGRYQYYLEEEKK
jgi:hypothetical protein